MKIKGVPRIGSPRRGKPYVGAVSQGVVAGMGVVVGSAPVNTVAPAITGTETPGQTLTCSIGTWTGAATITYTYQWFRGITSGGVIVTSGGLFTGNAIGSATNSTYVLQAGDVGEQLYCEVTATNGVGSAMKQSNSTGVINSAEASAFFARLATQPTAPRKTQYNTLISALVSAGVWAKLDALYVLAAADDATAITNLVQSSYGITVINAMTFTADQGFTGAGTKYLDTGFNPTTAVSPKFTQNDASVAVWMLGAGFDNGGSLGQPTSGTRIYLYKRYSDDRAYFEINDSGATSEVSLSGAGLIAASRIDSTHLISYTDGVLLVSATPTSNAPVNFPITLLLDNNAYSAGTVSAAAIGSKWSAGEHLALYNALHVYLQDVAGVA